MVRRGREADGAPETAVLGTIRVLVASFTLRYFGISFYVPFLLLYLHNALHLGFVLAGLCIGGVNAISPPLSLAGGGLSDRFGRRRMILGSLAAEAVALAGLAVALSYAVLPAILAAMVAAQASFSLGFPSTLAYVGDATDISTRTRAMSWVRVGGNIGYSGGIAVGGILLLVVAYWELAAIAALIVGLGALLGAVYLAPLPQNRFPSVPPEPLRAPAARRPTTILGGIRGSIRRSVRAFRQNPVLRWIGLAQGLSYIMFQQLNYSISTFALGGLALSYGVVGLGLALNGIVCILVPLPLARWLAGRPHTRAGQVGAGIIGAGLFAIGVDGYFRWAILPVFLLAVVTMTVGEVLAVIPTYTLPLNMAPETERGAYSGAMAMVTTTCTSISPILAGAALSASPNPLVIWGILAAPAIPAVAILDRVAPRVRPEHNRI